jgi:hypothetical protein
MRQHWRVIGVLLEHHEDVHAPLLKLELRVHLSSTYTFSTIRI